MNKVKNYIDIFLELAKVRITFFVSFSTGIGYILQKGELDFNIIFPILGVFLLASGASALNHFQERKTDLLMERTKNRPIPTKKISPTGVIIFAAILVLIGSFFLIYFTNVISLLLGLITLVWYNLIYTPLKRINALAVVPGSVIGALPPVIGWTAAGGNPFDYQAVALALFFFIWQIPHFWLLLLIHGKDYENAGFPTLTQIFSNQQLSRITFIWIAALVVSSFLIPVFELNSNRISVIGLFLFGAGLLFYTRVILSNYLEKVTFRNAFFSINLYVLIVVLILSIDKLFLTEF
ncbi:MAG: protoheme IX farnesyltransferase [Melioribacteraceae bacterium]|nr:protoheme IX farnesyltransferase [Melioribacteraceae bacterium]